jgi:hypothetical protein
MQTRTIFILWIFCCANSNCQPSVVHNDFVYWQNLTDEKRKETLALRDVYDSALDYFNGSLSLGDNAESKALLDSITLYKTSDRNVIAFYFFLFNKICLEGDGIISEGMGNYCQSIILRNPLYVFEYFLSDENVMEKYIQYLGYELYFKKEGTSTLKYGYSDFKQMIFQEIGKEKRYSEIVSLFFAEIDTVMKDMN